MVAESVDTYLAENSSAWQERSSKFSWNFFQLSEFPKIRSWIRSCRELNFVSSEEGSELTEEMVARWIDACDVVVIASDVLSGNPVGFFTLSRKEVAGIPESCGELCHLIVKPGCRYFDVGGFLCDVGKGIAKYLGNEILIGRAVPENRFGNDLAIREGFSPLEGKTSWAQPSFNWYRVLLTD